MNTFPTHLEIETTNVCQLSCGMCPHKIMQRKQGFMSFDLLKKIIKEAKGKTKTCYMHMIGEPLLHREIIEMISFVSSANIRTSISTNAMVLTEDTSKLLFNSGLNELTLALDSLDKDAYESMRSNGDFDTVLKNICSCLEIRKHIKTNTQIELQLIVMKENEHEIPAFKKLFESKIKGIGKLLIKNYSTFAGAVSDKAPQKTPPRRFKCSKLFNSMAILWNGDVVICCRDYDGVTKVGNVNTSTIKEIWNSDQYHLYRNQLKNNSLAFCEKC